MLWQDQQCHEDTPLPLPSLQRPLRSTVGCVPLRRHSIAVENPSNPKFLASPRPTLLTHRKQSFIGIDSKLERSALSSASSPQRARRHSSVIHSGEKDKRLRVVSDIEPVKKLSFVDCSVVQVREAINRANSTWTLNVPFWEEILTGKTSPSFKYLRNRTLSFWVAAYNNFLKAGYVSSLTSCIDGTQLRQIINISDQNLIDIAGLFDRRGAHRCRLRGFNYSFMQNALQQLKIPLIELMSAGVLLSRLITVKHKLQYLLGFVDLEDKRALNLDQFVYLIIGITRGLGAAFNVDTDIVPNRSDMETVGKRLFKRISAVAADRLRRIANGSHESRQQIIRAIHARQHSMAFGDASVMLRQGSEGHVQTIPYILLMDWFYGALSDQDAIALPYRLLLQRFCPLDDVADEFDDTLRDFGLSHTGPVLLPAITKNNTLHVEFPSKAEILYAWLIFKSCSERARFHHSSEDLEKMIAKIKIKSTWAWNLKISNALVTISEQKSCTGDRIEFPSLLRELYPWAESKHLRMFIVWCEYYDSLVDLEKSVPEADRAKMDFFNRQHRPVLPYEELEILKKEFHTLDRSGVGYITFDDISHAWKWEHDVEKNTLATFDLRQDGCIDLNGFLWMMCPTEYRLPEDYDCEKSNVIRLFGMVLHHETHSRKTSILAAKSQYERTQPDQKLDKLQPTPRSALPEVNDEDWQLWNRTFDGLDRNNDGRVEMADLESSGLFSASECETILSILRSDSEDNVTRGNFLDALLSAHSCKRFSFDHRSNKNSIVATL